MSKIYDSRFLTPYIVYSREFAISVPADGFARTNFAHNLPFLPLLVGQWSNSPNFEPSYDLAMRMPVFLGARPKRVCQVGADKQNIYFDLADNAGENCVFYFRIMALAPPDFYGDISTIYRDKTNFNFDSRMNYPKIADFQKVGESGVISHNLGFLPQVKFWSEVLIPVDANYRTQPAVLPMFSTLYGNSLNGVCVNENEVIYNFLGTGESYILTFGDGFDEN